MEQASKSTTPQNNYVNPAFYTQSDLDELLMYCQLLSVSDVTLHPGKHILIDKDGMLSTVGTRLLSAKDVEDMARFLYGDNAVALALSGKDLDIGYSLTNCGSFIDQRYRVNITACHYRSGVYSVEISIRLISANPPDLQSISVSHELYEAFDISQGIALVCGATGSGKTSLLAAVVQERLQSRHKSLKVLTYESPVEYLYRANGDISSVVSQTEIPRYLPGFAQGVRNALRRKPDLILVGECRDLETIDAVMEAALTGHPVYTTLHANGVVDTIKRILNLFRHEQRQANVDNFLSVIRLVVWQVLVPCLQGGRIALREYLKFGSDVRKKLLAVHPDKLKHSLDHLFKVEGVTLQQSAKLALEANQISPETYREVLRNYAN